jgi:hypothetical protein
MKIHILLFWLVTPSGLVVYGRFGKKAAFFFTAVSNMEYDFIYAFIYCLTTVSRS